jgi:hypothetical protein
VATLRSVRRLAPTASVGHGLGPECKTVGAGWSGDRHIVRKMIFVSPQIVARSPQTADVDHQLATTIHSVLAQLRGIEGSNPGFVGGTRTQPKRIHTACYVRGVQGRLSVQSAGQVSVRLRVFEILYACRPVGRCSRSSPRIGLNVAMTASMNMPGIS